MRPPELVNPLLKPLFERKFLIPCPHAGAVCVFRHVPSVAPGAALRCSAGYDALPQPSVFSLMLADRWVMTSRCGGLELYKYKFGQHGAAEHQQRR